MAGYIASGGARALQRGTWEKHRMQLSRAPKYFGAIGVVQGMIVCVKLNLGACCALHSLYIISCTLVGEVFFLIYFSDFWPDCRYFSVKVC